MRARLYDGHRPFGLVPIGYMRQKEGKNSMVVMKDKGMKSNSTQNTL